MANMRQNLISKLEKILCQLDATGVDYIFILFDAEIFDVQARANRLGQDFMKFSNTFEKFLEFCVSGTKQVQSINNGGDCSSEDDECGWGIPGDLDVGGEFQLLGTQVVKTVDIKNEVDDTTLIPIIPSKELFFKPPNEDQIGNRRSRGRPKGSKNKPKLKVEENDPKVDSISNLDDFKQEDCFVGSKEDTGKTKRNQKRLSGSKARNGIISELNQLNSITNSEFEFENNVRKSDESSLNVDEELGVKDSTTDSKSAEFEKERTAKKKKNNKK